MVHEFQLSVGGQVYLGETWALICLDMDKIVTSYLVDRPHESAWPGWRTYQPVSDDLGNRVPVQLHLELSPA